MGRVAEVHHSPTLTQLPSSIWFGWLGWVGSGGGGAPLVDSDSASFEDENKKTTAPGVPRRSPIQVLTGRNRA